MLARVWERDSDHQREIRTELPREPHQLAFLPVVKTRGLGSRSKRHEKIDSGLQLPSDQDTVGIVIDLSVPEWRYQGCTAAFQYKFRHISKVFWYSICP